MKLIKKKNISLEKIKREYDIKFKSILKESNKINNSYNIFITKNSNKIANIRKLNFITKSDNYLNNINYEWNINKVKIYKFKKQISIKIFNNLMDNLTNVKINNLKKNDFIAYINNNDSQVSESNFLYNKTGFIINFEIYSLKNTSINILIKSKSKNFIYCEVSALFNINDNLKFNQKIIRKYFGSTDNLMKYIKNKKIIKSNLNNIQINQDNIKYNKPNKYKINLTKVICNKKSKVKIKLMNHNFTIKKKYFKTYLKNIFNKFIINFNKRKSYNNDWIFIINYFKIFIKIKENLKYNNLKITFIKIKLSCFKYLINQYKNSYSKEIDIKLRNKILIKSIICKFSNFTNSKNKNCIIYTINQINKKFLLKLKILKFGKLKFKIKKKVKVSIRSINRYKNLNIDIFEKTFKIVYEEYKNNKKIKKNYSYYFDLIFNNLWLFKFKNKYELKIKELNNEEIWLFVKNYFQNILN